MSKKFVLVLEIAPCDVFCVPDKGYTPKTNGKADRVIQTALR